MVIECDDVFFIKCKNDVIKRNKDSSFTTRKGKLITYVHIIALITSLRIKQKIKYRQTYTFNIVTFAQEDDYKGKKKRKKMIHYPFSKPVGNVSMFYDILARYGIDWKIFAIYIKYPLRVTVTS